VGLGERQSCRDILDAAGEVVDRWVFAHTEQDLDTALARLASHGSPAELPVAIERADGLVVDRLLAAGHPVVAIDPGAFHAARPRWGAAGAKTDPGDSDKLADSLRTDGHRLRRLEPPDPVTRELQALVRLPRVGQLSHAQLLAELGPILDRASSAEHAAAQAGAAPVTRASGKTSSVQFRLAANHRARQALHSFADNARHSSPHGQPSCMPTPAPAASATPSGPGPWARLAPGHLACWHSNTADDPAKHRAEQRLAPDHLTQKTERAVARQLFKLLEWLDRTGVELVSLW
jgi:Transposase/Transposase IS116/IS110/IS902 family